MIPKIANILIPIDGMSCTGCESRIGNALRKTGGVDSAVVSFAKSQAMVTFDANMVDEASLVRVVESLGYQVRKQLPAQSGKTRTKPAVPAPRVTAEPQPRTPAYRIVGIGIILLALYVLLRQLGGLNMFNVFPQAKQGMSLILVFGIGLLTSVHCLAMCGGINLSQCLGSNSGADQNKSVNQNTGTTGNTEAAKRTSRLKPAVLYNAGRVVSYTVLGGAVGALGSVISFSGWAKGLVAILAGVFMVIMGINLLGLFPWLRRLNPRLPGFLARLAGRVRQNGSRPFYVGLVNGLMPCGPLQAMQLFALSTGSPLKGAAAMFLFSLGTVPLMFGFGALSAQMSRKFSRTLMQFSAMLVVVLGLFMLQNGMALSGMTLPNPGNLAAASSTQQTGIADMTSVESVQLVTTELGSQTYPPITVKAGIPVKWTIHAAPGTVNGCNGRLIIPKYNLVKELAEGDNIIEFTPDKAGRVPYSCWMGMIRSQITVVAGS
jgi:uncharacterized protein